MKARRSDIIYIYSSKNCIPNGDPFTGEQRIDEATSRVLISDVRIKRYIRDIMIEKNVLLDDSQKRHIYLREIPQQEIDSIVGDTKGISASAAQMKILKALFKDDPSVASEGKKKKDFDSFKIMLKCDDVRLFGGISTEKDDNVNITGPVQFANLNPSLNKVHLRLHQNTSVFQSSIDKSQGAIGTTSLVPYSINQVVGWVNPLSAAVTGLTDEEVTGMLANLWDAVNLKNSRSKSNQDSHLIIRLNYSDPFYKTSILDSLIKISDPDNVDIRDISDVAFDFSGVNAIASKDVVESVDYRVSSQLEGTFLKQLDTSSSKLNKI